MSSISVSPSCPPLSVPRRCKCPQSALDLYWLFVLLPDMINMLKLNFVPLACGWIFSHGDAIPAVVVWVHRVFLHFTWSHHQASCANCSLTVHTRTRRRSDLSDIGSWREHNRATALRTTKPILWLPVLSLFLPIKVAMWMCHFALYPNREQPWLRCYRSEKENSKIHVFDGRGVNEPLHTEERLHSQPVILIQAGGLLALVFDRKSDIRYNCSRVCCLYKNSFLRQALCVFGQCEWHFHSCLSSTIRFSRRSYPPTRWEWSSTGQARSTTTNFQKSSTGSSKLRLICMNLPRFVLIFWVVCLLKK